LSILSKPDDVMYQKNFIISLNAK